MFNKLGRLESVETLKGPDSRRRGGEKARRYQVHLAQINELVGRLNTHIERRTASKTSSMSQRKGAFYKSRFESSN